MTGKSDFPRSKRLLTPSDYAGVFSKSERLADKYWTVLVRKDTHSTDKGRVESSEKTARLGLAIAKKRARRAVDRNRLKRIAREQFRLHQKSLAGADLVVLNRDAATGAENTELHRSLARLFKKVGKRRNP